MQTSINQSDRILDTNANTKHIFTAEEVTGPVLRLWKVSRMDMGAYMCIAKVSLPFFLDPICVLCITRVDMNHNQHFHKRNFLLYLPFWSLNIVMGFRMEFPQRSVRGLSLE